ncbi:MAG: biotin carboxyl carrier protein [Actinobacteria bacterium]|nr:biotin carboxyl carrier protein [Actinomycetota bacterium]
MTPVGFIDTTVRDGQASLWAMNMRTRHVLPAMPHLDAAGFDAIEFLAPGSRLKKFVRHLGENPWDWIKLGAQQARNTQLRWHGAIDGASMSGTVPPEVGELLIKKVVDLGIRFTRTGNNWNNYTNMGAEIERFEGLGMTPVINVMYSVSPRHTDAYFIQKAKQAGALEPFRLCFKDVGGLLTPERTRKLLPEMMKVAGDIPWEFHGHCNNGLGPLNALESVKAGVRYVHTAVPPLANGNSQPSVYNVARNLRAMGYEPEVDEEALRPVTDHFTYIARREGFEEGTPLEYDQRLYSHQIPGGMISNLRYQLRLAGVEDRLQETLEETGRVRADFGYPIMVTPLSQFVGSQAAINVIVGERYRQVTDQTIEYALGVHGGDEAINSMDPEVRAKILDRPRARELDTAKPPQPTLAELRRKYGSGVSDEDLILRAIVGDDATDVVGSAGQTRRDRVSGQPLVELVRELSERDGHRFVSMRTGDLSLTIQKGSLGHERGHGATLTGGEDG